MLINSVIHTNLCWLITNAPFHTPRPPLPSLSRSPHESTKRVGDRVFPPALYAFNV